MGISEHMIPFEAAPYLPNQPTLANKPASTEHSSTVYLVSPYPVLPNSSPFIDSKTNKPTQLFYLSVDDLREHKNGHTTYLEFQGNSDGQSQLIQLPTVGNFLPRIESNSMQDNYVLCLPSDATIALQLGANDTATIIESTPQQLQQLKQFRSSNAVPADLSKHELLNVAKNWYTDSNIAVKALQALHATKTVIKRTPKEPTNNSNENKIQSMFISWPNF